MNILVIDIGTSSTRGVLFSPKGERLCTARRTYTPETGEGGNAVWQSAESFRDAMMECAGEAAKSGAKISAVALTAQRSSVIPTDRSGEAIAPAIMWHDKRSAGICDDVNAAHRSTLTSIGGMIALPTHSAPKMLYIKRAMPEIYAAAYKLMGIQDYLLCALTGNFVTDRSLASRSMLMDMRSGRWSPRLAEIFEVSGEKLCELLPTGTVCGCVTEKAAALTGIPAGTPVITCGGDQQSAVLGLGVRSPGTAVINIGTGSYAAAVSESYVDSGDSGVSVLRSAVEGKWLLEASAPSAGDAVKWFCSAFYDDPTAYERITSDAEKAKPGAGGVVASCSINGTGTPGWNTAVRGFFAGISAGTGRAEMARALLEAIAADAAENLTAAERLSGCAGKVRAAGGITGTPLFRQMLCDTIGRPVEFTADSEATSLGAWATAAAAMGLFGSAGEAADAVAPERETFLPNMENHEAYKAANERRKMEEK